MIKDHEELAFNAETQKAPPAGFFDNVPDAVTVLAPSDEPVAELVAEPEPIAEPEPAMWAEPEPAMWAEPEPAMWAEPEPEPIAEPAKRTRKAKAAPAPAPDAKTITDVWDRLSEISAAIDAARTPPLPTFEEVLDKVAADPSIVYPSHDRQPHPLPVRLSASKIQLARRCAYPFAGWTDARNRSDEMKYANNGTSVHAQIEHTIRTGDRTPQSDEHRAWLDDWYDCHKDLPWRVETALAIEPVSGRAMYHDIDGHRDYRLFPIDFVPGQVDCWAVYDDALGESVLHVIDWKTGFGGHLEAARQSDQLMDNACALAAALPQAPTTVIVEYIKIDADRCFPDRAELTFAERLVFLDELTDLVGKISNSPEPRPGPWCKSEFCPLLGRCPATEGALERLNLGLDAVEFEGFRIEIDYQAGGRLDDDRFAAWQYVALQAIEKRVQEAWQALKDRADVDPIEMADGKVYRPQTKTREVIDTDNIATIPALRSVLGDDAYTAVETTTVVKITNGAVNSVAAAKAKELGTKVAMMKLDVWDALRKAGVTKMTSWTEYRMTKSRNGDDE